MIELSEDSLALRVRAEWIGPDVLVTLSGGDRPHIGAVAVGEYHPSLNGDGTPSASVSLYCGVGHRDGEPAMRLAKALSTCLQCRSTVVVGVHFDRFDVDRLSSFWAFLASLCDHLPDQLQNHRTE